ncbi:flagella synthesis protein FlgN [Propionivibrio dicarboxylicus]|uniref:Flagella synthesis protein FlgN n=1 Tax=Propionivibrio dicarboxylicus TaxID=83767 RepID=A0A1G8HFR7_9RHOO|nr:flagellar protein FlgN [Propionivibrio dicarboxylicus]SDI05422.1 flagella synthesis protein FlgN [Propionivibrio dicarboxylicus]
MHKLSSTLISQLRDSLQSERDQFAAFVNVLEQEQDILKRGDTEALPKNVDIKDQLAERLGALAMQRNALLQQLGFPADRPGIEAFCANLPAEKYFATLWAEIIALATRAKEINRVSGALVDLRMHFNSQVLGALQGNPSSSSVYGPDGQTRPHNLGRLNDSA